LIAVRASKRALARDVSVMDRENGNLSAIPAAGIRAAAKKQTSARPAGSSRI